MLYHPVMSPIATSMYKYTLPHSIHSITKTRMICLFLQVHRGEYEENTGTVIARLAPVRRSLYAATDERPCLCCPIAIATSLSPVYCLISDIMLYGV